MGSVTNNSIGSRCGVMIVGDTQVGKTTLRMSFITGGLVPIDPTDDLRCRQVTVDSVETVVIFHDIDVIPSHPVLRDSLVRNCEAAILVYDVGLRRSFDFIKTIHEEISSAKRSTKNQSEKTIVFCVVGNKTDCSRQIETIEGEKLAASLGSHFFEASASKMDNINECLYDTIREVRKQQICSENYATSEKKNLRTQIEYFWGKVGKMVNKIRGSD